MKKIELHLHLDGSLDIEYAKSVVGRDVYNEMVSRNDKSLTEYLEKFLLPNKLLQDYKHVVEFSKRLALKLKEEEVIYAEVRFCPYLHDKKISVDGIITGIRDGFSQVPEVKINLILCMMRHFDFEKNYKVIKLAKKYLGNGVCGIDLAGDEANYSTRSFKVLFDIVRDEGIPFTIHAGEADSYRSVREAISFGAKRIGHGIRSIEDRETIEMLIQNNVYLEVCLDSNLDTGVVQSIEKHPIKKLVELGVAITINTDNRTVSNTSLNHEYQYLKEQFGFTDEDILQFNLNAVNAAFLSREEKLELKSRLLEK